MDRIFKGNRKECKTKQKASRVRQQRRASEPRQTLHQTPNRLFVQKKLRVGASHDQYERQADRVSDYVLQNNARDKIRSVLSTSPSSVQSEHLGRATSANSKNDGATVTSTVSPTVSQTLSQSGRPLDDHTKTFFESRFDRDFSNVRVHTDQVAAQSAGDIDARAYTVNNHVVFSKDQFDPNSSKGQRLLAHELTHVVQQSAAKAPLSIQRTDPDPAISRRRSGGNLESMLPGYSQEGDSCGAASLVTALMIWDRDQSGHSNELILGMLNTIQIWLIRHRQQTIDGWDRRGMNGAEVYSAATQVMDNARSHATQPGGRMSESDYRSIGLILYAMYVDGTAGLSSADIWNLQLQLGLQTDQQQNVFNYSQIFSNTLVSGLNAGQIAQIGWMVRTGPVNAQGLVPLGHHAFLIGRLQSGEWFWSDQGPRPAVEFHAATLTELQTQVTAQASSGQYWIYTGSSNNIMGWTGVRLLAGPSGAQAKAQSLIASGTMLAEIDVGALTIGDTVNCGRYHTTAYTLSDATSAASGVRSGHGAVIAEIPSGVFYVYETNAIRTANMGASSIDASAGGVLTRRIFYSARLLITDGSTSSMIHVY